MSKKQIGTYVRINKDKEGKHENWTEFSSSKSFRKIPKSTVSAKTSSTQFSKLVDDIEQTLSSYKSTMKVLLVLPEAQSAMFRDTELLPYLQKKGTLKSTKKHDTYFVEEKHSGQILKMIKSSINYMGAGTFVNHVFVLGLISVYDNFLRNICLEIGKAQPRIFISGDKTFSYSDLLEYSNTDELSRVLLEKSIDDLMRDTHSQQVLKLFKKLNIPFNEKDLSFRKLIEVCEIRNIFAHTGGVISEQFIKKCKEYEIDYTKYKIGESIKPNFTELIGFVDDIREFCLKLGFVIRNKIETDNTDDICSDFQYICFDLIKEKQYLVSNNLAQHILGQSSESMKESTRLMFIINICIAEKKLNEKHAKDKGFKSYDWKSRLGNEDWSAVSDQFKIVLAAINEELDEVILLMKKIGKNKNVISQSNYLDWPAFDWSRETDKFKEAYAKIFNESITGDMISANLELDNQ